MQEPSWGALPSPATSDTPQSPLLASLLLREHFPAQSLLVTKRQWHSLLQYRFQALFFIYIFIFVSFLLEKGPGSVSAALVLSGGGGLGKKKRRKRS